jgi:signal recognition particle subunit SRP54
MPGMGPIPGMHGGKKQQPQGKKKKVGNPAKRAALASGAVAAPQQAPAGAGLGLGAGKNGKAPTEEELASLQKFLGR